MGAGSTKQSMRSASRVSPHTGSTGTKGPSLEAVLNKVQPSGAVVRAQASVTSSSPRGEPTELLLEVFEDSAKQLEDGTPRSVLISKHTKKSPAATADAASTPRAQTTVRLRASLKEVDLEADSDPDDEPFDATTFARLRRDTLTIEQQNTKLEEEVEQLKQQLERLDSMQTTALMSTKDAGARTKRDTWESNPTATVSEYKRPYSSGTDIGWPEVVAHRRSTHEAAPTPQAGSAGPRPSRRNSKTSVLKQLNRRRRSSFDSDLSGAGTSEGSLRDGTFTATWGEVELLLRKTVEGNEDIGYVLTACEVGLLFIAQLGKYATSLGCSRGMLSRWILPYDTSTTAAEQSSVVQQVLQNVPPDLRGKLTDNEVRYLVRGANAVRKLVRVKVADDNDWEQAKMALITTTDVFKRLVMAASERGVAPFQVLEEMRDTDSKQSAL